MSKVSAKLKEEFLALLPPTIFFFVALHIVAFIRVLMLEGTGISPLGSVSIAVAALILGKAVLLADMLHREICDQLDRASLSSLLNTAEGNGKRQGKQRAQIFR